VRTIGVTMVRDEADIVETTVRHMLKQTDGVIVADNLSTDGTFAILTGMAQEHSNLVVYVDDEVGYEQSKKMTALAHLAHEEFGAEWIVPFDADEIWYGPTFRIADFLRLLPQEHDIVEARLYDHVCSGFDDPSIADPVERIQHRRGYAAPLRKVACRYRPDLVIEMGNHGATYTDSPSMLSDRCIAIRHFPYRSPEQVVRKVRNGAQAYAATDLPETFGAHWRQWGVILEQQGEEAIHNLFHQWYYQEDPTRGVTIDGEPHAPLLLDPAPVSR
jgi:glycosyltransferase involved in cell wall biosynthesis